ncbi:armadillo-type protein [Dichotomocladium elegans]|nr:armadillo-type protein [Dichotomocladium elegans]
MDQYLAELDELLTRLASAQDSETIRLATSSLNSHYYKSANCIPALAEIIDRSPHYQVRQLAAVELRKRINKWWPDIQEDNKSVIRNQLLQISLNDEKELVRHSTARVISSIAHLDIPRESWPELLTFLHQACTSPDASHREVGTYLLYTLFEAIADYFMQNTTPLYELLATSIVDPESIKVRVTTVLILGKLGEFVEPENKEDIKWYRGMIPNMVNVLEQCLENNNEEGAAEVFEVFDTLLMLDTPLLSTHLVELIRFFLTVGSNREIEESIRIMALSFLMWAAIYKQNKIRSLKLVGFLVEGLMPIGTEEDPEDMDEDSPSRVAFKVLNALASNMPPQQVIPILMPIVVNYMQNPDPGYRKGAMVAFAVVVEGCAEYMSSKLPELLPIVCSGLCDSDIMVRRGACMALGCLAEELQTEISEHHQALLPLVLNLVEDNNSEVIKHACNALDAILEGLGEEVVQYLPMLMDKLLVLLDNATQTETTATIIAAIGSAAHSAGGEFNVYFEQVMPRIRGFMAAKEGNDQLMLRGVASDAAGAIAEAVGAEKFRHCTHDMMHLAIEQLNLDSPRLRECSYAFFAILARVFGEEFAPYLPTIIPPILASCRAEEQQGCGFMGEIDLLSCNIDDGDDDNSHDEGAGMDVAYFNSAVADEKEFAADALGELFQNTRYHFLPYVEASIQELTQLSCHLSEGVRKAVVGSMFAFLRTFYTISSATAEWTPGLPPNYPVHENVQSMIMAVVPTVLTMWADEDDRLVVAHITQEMVQALKLMGPCIVSEHVEEIARNLLEIFEKRSMCQIGDEDDDYADEDEEAESESLLISAAADLVAMLCEAIGEGFSSYFDVFLPLIAKYYKKTKTPQERSMAIGCLGECIRGVKSAVTPHAARLLQLFLKSLGDEDPSVRSNSAYAIGLLFSYSRVNLMNQIPVAVSALHPLFNNQTLLNATDNAAGSLARILLAYPQSAYLDQVLPIFIGALPLKADVEENEPVFDFIFHLFRSNHPFVLNHLPDLCKIFLHVLSDENQLKPKTRAQLIELVQAIHVQTPNLHLETSQLARFL